MKFNNKLFTKCLCLSKFQLAKDFKELSKREFLIVYSQFTETDYSKLDDFLFIYLKYI